MMEKKKQKFYAYAIFMGIFIIVFLIIWIFNHISSYTSSTEYKVNQELNYLDKIWVKTYIINEKNIDLLKYSKVNLLNLEKNPFFSCPFLAEWKTCTPKYDYLIIEVNWTYVAACKDKYSYKRCLTGKNFLDLIKKIKTQEINKLIKNVE